MRTAHKMCLQTAEEQLRVQVEMVESGNGGLNDITSSKDFVKQEIILILNMGRNLSKFISN